jgi:phosphoglucomutase
MQELFDFAAIRNWLQDGHRIRFDAMHGVTGPYARRILVDLLGCPPDSILHAESLPDFGGLHPDPNPIDAAELVAESLRPDSADLLAASDGDGDRNMILGPGFFLSPGDSVAMMLASLPLLPGYRNGVTPALRVRCQPAAHSTWLPQNSASPAMRHQPAGDSSATCLRPA